MTPMAWQKILQADSASIQYALTLLQATMSGYELVKVPILQGKMQDGTNPMTKHHALHLFSYGDPSDPQVSAFFLLRRRRNKGSADAPGQWAYCLTIGAKDSANGGLSSANLRDALNEVCLTMQNSVAHGMELEVMHLPPMPGINPQNLQDVFTELHSNAVPPKKIPRFNDMGAITLGYPWVPLDATGNEVFKQFVRLQIMPKP
jgi:hypothetical protein